MTDEGFENVVHQGLKSCQCVGQSKWHDQKLEVSLMSAEWGLFNVVRVHANLMIAAVQIELGEEVCTPELIEEFIDDRNGKLVFNRVLVQGAAINTKAPCTIVLLDE